MKNNNYLDEFRDQLSEAYLDKYVKIQQYILNSNLFYDKKYECLEEILDLLLSAQMDGKSPEAVLGNDVKGFCLNILKSVHSENLSIRIGVSVIRGCVIAFVVGLFFYLMSLWFGETLYVSGGKVSILMTYGLGFGIPTVDAVIDAFIRNQIIKQGGCKFLKIKTKISIASSVLVGLIMGLIHGNLSKTMKLDILFVDLATLLIVPVVIFVMMMILMYIDHWGGFQFMLSEANKREIKRRRKAMLREGLFKKYQRKKASKEKRGKEFTIDDFKRRQEYEIKLAHIVFCLSLPLYLAFELFCIVNLLQDGLVGNNFMGIVLIVIIMLVIWCDLKFISFKNPQLKMLEELQ